MDEQTHNNEESKENQPEEKKENVVFSAIENATAAAELLRKENDRKEEILNKEIELQARKELGGYTEGGRVEEKKEETPQEYAQRILRNEHE